MKIAVAYNNGEIHGHFGHCDTFAVYEYGEYVTDCQKTLIETGDRQGHQAMADLMKEQDVAAVIVGNMGPEAKTVLLSYGIVPIVGYSGDADTAADLLVTGQLPVAPGNEHAGGGCSCGGGCCGGEHEEGGCSCSGGCSCGCGDGAGYDGGEESW